MRTRSREKAAKAVLATLVVMALATASLAAPGHAKVAPDLASVRGGDVRVIVTYGAKVKESDLPDLMGHGSKVHRKLAGIHAVSAWMSSREIARLASDPRVLAISPDRQVVSSMDIAVPSIGADRITRVLNYTGRGVTVALVDSGIAASDAIERARILTSVDFTSSTPRDTDAFGHGTHVAGIIGGSGTNGAVGGVAPGVTFVSLKVLDGQGTGYVSNVIEAIDWAIAQRARYGIRVLNLSLGHAPMESYRTDPLARAVERAWAAGLVVVVSASAAFSRAAVSREASSRCHRFQGSSLWRARSASKRT
ncbi:MAG: S8 family serine peptidase, partial [Acidobacteriia bacterium]|nr:S8 family serine peptidase [Terriglobia bacterium]